MPVRSRLDELSITRITRTQALSLIQEWAQASNTDQIPISKLPPLVTQAEAEAGILADRRLWSPERIAQAIEALAESGTNVDIGIDVQYATESDAEEPVVLTRTYEADIDIFGFGVDADEIYASSGLIILGLSDNADDINNLADDRQIGIVQGSNELIVSVDSRQNLLDTIVLYNVTRISGAFSFTDGEEVIITIIDPDVASWHFISNDDDNFYRLGIDGNWTSAFSLGAADWAEQGNTDIIPAAKLPDVRSSRSESVAFQGMTGITSGSTAFSIATSNPVTVEHGNGDAEIITSTGSGNFTVAQAGVYVIAWEASIDQTSQRPTPALRVYRDADTIGTDSPIGQTDSLYLRYAVTDQPIHESGVLTVPSDNLACKAVPTNIVGTQSFDVDAGSKLYLYRTR